MHICIYRETETEIERETEREREINIHICHTHMSFLGQRATNNMSLMSKAWAVWSVLAPFSIVFLAQRFYFDAVGGKQNRCDSGCPFWNTARGGETAQRVAPIWQHHACNQRSSTSLISTVMREKKRKHPARVLSLQFFFIATPCPCIACKRASQSHPDYLPQNTRQTQVCRCSPLKCSSFHTFLFKPSPSLIILYTFQQLYFAMWYNL